MKGKFTKGFRLFLVYALVTIFSAVSLCMTCDARGSGSTTTKSPTAGYKTGNYTAGGSTQKSTTGGSTQKSTTGGTTQKSTTGYGYGGTTNGGSTGGGTNVFFFGGLFGAGHSHNYASPGDSSTNSGSGGGYIAFFILLIILAVVIYFIVRNKKKKGNTMNRYTGESFDVKQELAEYKELYAGLIFGIDDVHDYLEKADLDKRRCVKLLPVLSQYIEMLESAVGDGKHAPAVSQSLYSFRQEHHEELEKLKDCVKCKCLKCARDCNMQGCSRCEPTFRNSVAFCDNKESAVWTFEDRTIQLLNNDTGEDENLKVLAVIEDLKYKQLYIILERDDSKVVLYYYPDINKDGYGQITDTDDLEFAVKAYENIHLS